MAWKVGVGSTYQAWNANLDTWAGVASSANGRSLVSAADYAAMKVLLDLEIGIDVQAYNANLTTFAGIAPAANTQALLAAADYAAMKVLLSLNNVTNTSDANKPVSTAQQTALDLKANLASPALTGTPTAPTAAVATDTTQVATTAFVAAAAALKLSLAGGTMSGAIAMGTSKITGMGDPTTAQDAATKAYVDSMASGLTDFKQSVRVATNAALPANTGTSGVLTATGNGVLTVDGVATVSGDRILVKNEVAGGNNGIYSVTTEGTAGVPYVLTRTSDADISAEVTTGMYMWVSEGTANANSAWILSTTGTIVLNTTSLTFVQFSGISATDAGAGLTLTGHVLSVNVDASSIEISADTLQVKAGGITNAMLAGSILPAKLDGTLAGDGLASTSGVLSINVGQGLAIVSDTVGITDGGVTDAKIAASAGIPSSKLSTTAFAPNANNDVLGSDDGTTSLRWGVFSGAVNRQRVSVGAGGNYTALVSDHVIQQISTSLRVIDLPAITAANDGWELKISATNAAGDSGGATITPNAAAGDKVNNAATLALASGGGVTLIAAWKGADASSSWLVF